MDHIICCATKYLKSKFYHFPGGWVEACIEWLFQEHKDSIKEMSNKVWCDLIEQQWLFTDLRDFETSSLLNNVPNDFMKFNSVACFQIMSFRNISKSYYSQIRELNGTTNENTLVSSENHENNNVDGNRTLMITITDSVNEFDAFEYKSWTNIETEKIKVGCKCCLKGPFFIRKKVAFLKQENIEILGGEVDELSSISQLSTIEEHLKRNTAKSNDTRSNFKKGNKVSRLKSDPNIIGPVSESFKDKPYIKKENLNNKKVEPCDYKSAVSSVPNGKGSMIKIEATENDNSNLVLDDYNRNKKRKYCDDNGSGDAVKRHFSTADAQEVAIYQHIDMANLQTCMESANEELLNLQSIELSNNVPSSFIKQNTSKEEEINISPDVDINKIRHTESSALMPNSNIWDQINEEDEILMSLSMDDLETFNSHVAQETKSLTSVPKEHDGNLMAESSLNEKESFTCIIDIFNQLSNPELCTTSPQSFKVKAMVLKFTSPLKIVNDSNLVPRWNLQVMIGDGTAMVNCVLEDGFVSKRIGFTAQTFQQTKNSSSRNSLKMAVQDFQGYFTKCNCGIFILHVSDNWDNLCVADYSSVDNETASAMRERILQMA